MTDFIQFGKQLQFLRKQAGLSQEQLARDLDQRARTSQPEEYRVVDGTLSSRWERACVRAGRRWRPTRHYPLLLIDLFAMQLTYESAQTWASQAGYTLSAKELKRWFMPLVEAPRGGVAPVAEKDYAVRGVTHNLPVPLSSFVGRRNELAILIDFLTCTRTRLVTIVGEGGVGKTRLALAVVHTLLEMQTTPSESKLFADGIWFVPLAGVEMTNPADLVNQLVFAVASVFSLPFQLQQMDSMPLTVQGRHDAALQQLDNAAQVATQLDLPLVRAKALHAMFRCLLPFGEIERANTVLEEALHLYQRAGNRLGEGFVLRSLGYVAHFQGEEETALHFWQQAVNIYQELADRPRLISIWQHLGDAYAALGDLGRAYQYYNAAYSNREGVHDPRHAAHTADGFARLLIRLGRCVQVRWLCQQALLELRQLGDQVGVIEALCTLGMAELQMDSATAALACYQEALQRSREASAQIH